MSMFRQGWRAEAEKEAWARRKLQAETDAAIARERAIATARFAETPCCDVFKAAGFQAHAGYILERWTGYPSSGGGAWKAQAVTLDLAKACAWADEKDQRVVLRRVYRLPDGSLSLPPPNMAVLQEV